MVVNNINQTPHKILTVGEETQSCFNYISFRNMSKNPRFFSFDYLINTEFSEDDLYSLFECDSLLYSLIKEMYLACDEYTSFDLICKKIKKDKNWMNENHFKTKRKLENFIHQAELAVKNVYQYSETQAKIWVQCFMIKYGFPLHQKC